MREIDRTKLFKKLGHRSLFQYVTDRLGFTASVAYAFVSVTRKSAIIPALKTAIENKHLTVTKASRIASSLPPENAASLIEFAGTHSCRKTEREVARLNPKASRPDRVKPVAENLNEIQGTISDQVNEKLKRAESLMAQIGKATDLNSVLEAALDEYLKHHDPVKKASRGLALRAKSKATREAKNETNSKNSENSKAATELLRTRKNHLLSHSSADHKKTAHPKAPPIRESENTSINAMATDSKNSPIADEKREPENSSPLFSPAAQFRSTMDSSAASQRRLSVTAPKRVPLTAEQKHLVFHCDQGRCTHLNESGKRCNSDRWVDLHHIIEVSRGGTNEPSNLTVLCSFHHDLVHQLSLAIEGQVNWLREPRSRYS